MSERSSFYRKVMYGGIIVLLLFPLAWLSMPATVTEAGGKLAQMRSEHRLSQSNLGEVDPASETIKLATLGLRGVAVNLLWEKANYYKKTEDWTNLTATLEQLAKLQPNFITFWKFQAWNLSYNVSVEFDDYKDRYYFVRRGIQFLMEGERYNSDNPHLLWDLGWFIGQKIGRADEHVQYRRLFKIDDDFHPPTRTPDQRDNWLVGKEYYLKGVDAVDNKGRSMDRKSPRIFYSSPAMSQMNYAEAIEEDGFFDKARRGWIKAQEEWERFGQMVIEHSTGVKLRLGDQSRLEEEVAKLGKKFEEMGPGVKDKLMEEKRKSLTEDERKALSTPPDKMTPALQELAYTASGKLSITNREIADQMGKDNPEKANQALQMANELDRLDQQLRFTINYKTDSNYDYWYTRAKFEQTPNALAAREDMFRAHRAFRDADLLTAKQLYKDGFAKWRLVFDEFPTVLSNEASTGDDLIEYIIQYRDVLDQLDESLDESFPLWDVVARFDNEQKLKEELAKHEERIGTAKPKSAADAAEAKLMEPLQVKPKDASKAKPKQ